MSSDIRTEVRNIITAYIKETLRPAYGISKEALELLELLMMCDSNFNTDLLSTYDTITRNNSTYYALPSNHDAAINYSFFERLKDLKEIKEKINGREC